MPNNEIEIKGMENGYLSDVLKFCNEFIGDGYYSLEQLKILLEQSKKREKCVSFCAYDKDKLVGIRITLAPGKWIDNDTKGLTPERWNVPVGEVAYFKSLFIRDDYQKRGIGSLLSNTSIEALKEIKTSAIICHSWLESPNNSSQIYLKKMGFISIKEHKKFWYDLDYTCSRCGVGKCICSAEEMIKYLE